jgi:hypothetical protein
MLREVALRKALQHGRDRRQGELDEVQERGRALRRRLRELTDRSLALGSVHGRFVLESAPPPAVGPAEPALMTAPAPSPPPALRIEDVRAVLAPPKEEAHEALLAALAARYKDGFTVGQMREVLDEVESGRVHTYDAAWTLANNLLRSRAFEVAGSRPGPAGPIRVLRVAAPLAVTGAN